MAGDFRCHRTRAVQAAVHQTEIVVGDGNRCGRSKVPLRSQFHSGPTFKPGAEDRCMPGAVAIAGHACPSCRMIVTRRQRVGRKLRRGSLAGYWSVHNESNGAEKLPIDTCLIQRAICLFQSNGDM